MKKLFKSPIKFPKLFKLKKLSRNLYQLSKLEKLKILAFFDEDFKKEVEKIVDRRIEVPIVQERIVTVPEIINQVVVERIEVPRIVEVERWNDKIIT